MVVAVDARQHPPATVEEHGDRQIGFGGRRIQPNRHLTVGGGNRAVLGPGDGVALRTWGGIVVATGFVDGAVRQGGSVRQLVEELADVGVERHPTIMRHWTHGSRAR